MKEMTAYVIEYHQCFWTWETIPTPGNDVPIGRCTYVHLDGLPCGSSAHVAAGFVTAFVPRVILRATIDAYRKAQDDA